MRLRISGERSENITDSKSPFQYNSRTPTPEIFKKVNEE